MNNSLFAQELKHRFPDQINVAQAAAYQDVILFCQDSLYFSDSFRDLLTVRSARLVNWKREPEDHTMVITIAPKHREYVAQDRRRQISLKLDPENDRLILDYLKDCGNVQGLIKSLLTDHIAALKLQEDNNAYTGTEGR